MGSLDELHRWADETYHVDFADDEMVLDLAANAITNGVWRNSTEIENIHAAIYKRPGMKEPRGLSDAEMMVGNIETSRLIRRALVEEDYLTWWQIAEAGLFDYDRPYAGTPLTAHVTKKVLTENTKKVRAQMNWMMLVDDLVGRERFLRGTALCALSYPHYGTPMWGDTIDEWVDQFDEAAAEQAEMRATGEDDLVFGPRPSREVVETMRTDPTLLGLDVIESCLNWGLHGAPFGRLRWHSRKCGDPGHSATAEVTRFKGIFASITGLPEMWMYAVADLPRDNTQRETLCTGDES